MSSNRPSPSSTPTVLVTGATGFLGGHILAALREADAVTIAAARDATRIPAWFDGETRIGDLTDPAYRREVVQGADVIIHAGTWSSFWGHARQERELFLEPALDLIDQSVDARVGRFIAASSVALGTPSSSGALVDDNEAPVARAFWPHHAAMVDLERRQRGVAAAGSITRMISMRLGHFVGAGNSMGLVSAIVPRLKTRQVPWVNHGRAHLPLASGADMGRAFALAATAPAGNLAPFEAINIVGPTQPTVREVFSHIAAKAGVPAPAYSVPLGAAYGFGALMEALHPILPGRAPFLTRSLVHVGEDWLMSTDKAERVLGFTARDDWKDAVEAQLEARRSGGFSWPELAQPIG